MLRELGSKGWGAGTPWDFQVKVKLVRRNRGLTGNQSGSREDGLLSKKQGGRGEPYLGW